MPIGRGMDTIPGTRLLACPFGLIGSSCTDPNNPRRVWTVVHELAPVYSGDSHVRLRVLDQLGFVSFIPQMDFNLLRGITKPGEFDPWRMKDLPEIGDYNSGWTGLAANQEDLVDDLHIRELELRSKFSWSPLPSLELTRYVHTSSHKDEALLEMLLWDADPETGLGPDMRLETIDKRWSRVQREVVLWQ